MFSLFGKRDPEASFLKAAESILDRADCLSRMVLVMQLLSEAEIKQYYNVQIHIIEKYTEWEKDPYMSLHRETALLLRDGNKSFPPQEREDRSTASSTFEKVTISCKSCSQRLAVPAGRRVNVTCPKCNNSFLFGS